jgi:hypothetical protein
MNKVLRGMETCGKPIACALAAIIVFQRFKEESFVPDYLKEEMDSVIK